MSSPLEDNTTTIWEILEAVNALPEAGGSGGGSLDSDIETQWIAAIEKGETPITKIPNGVTSLGEMAFYGCTNLLLTSLPDGITNIGYSAFNGCTNLALTSLPNALVRIENFAFQDCINLRQISFPFGLERISISAFSKCTNLSEVTFKGTPDTIASNAFNGCTNLKTINVPWAEGEVANAPWGATNATINYNYTGG